MHRTRLLTALAATAGLAFAAPAVAAPPVNDDIADAITVPGTTAPDAVTYNLLQATTEGGEATFSNTAKQTVWYRWSPTETGAAYADVCFPPSGANYVRVWRIDTSKALSIDALLHAGTWPSEIPAKSTSCRVRWKAQAGKSYAIQIDRATNASFVHQLTVRQDTSPPAAPVISIPDFTSATLKSSFTTGNDTAMTTCSLDNAMFKACSSGADLGPLSAGEHEFRVWAYDAMGNVTPAADRTWTVDALAPTTSVSPPPAVVAFDAAQQVAFAVLDDRPGATSQCRVDGGAFEPCTAPLQLPKLPAGPHTLEIRSTDAVGNVEAEPQKVSWTVSEAPKAADETKPSSERSSSTATQAAGPVPCTLSLKAPKRVSRKALRKGLRKAVRLSVKTTGPCKAKVALKKRKGKVAVVVTAGALKRTASVKVG